MRTSAPEHGPHIGRPLSVTGSFVCLDFNHLLMSLCWHPTPTHFASAHGG